MKSHMRKLPDGSIEVHLPTTPAARRCLEERFETLRQEMDDPTLDDGLCLGLLMLQRVVEETDAELRSRSTAPWTSRSIDSLQICGQPSGEGINDRNLQA